MTATTTLIGNTTSDVEIRYTQAGKAVGNVTIAVSDRKFDRQKNEWVDSDVWFARCTLWGEIAEHVAGSIHKGTRVIAEGRIGQREWQDKDGVKRISVEITLDEIGPSLRYATAQVTRAASGGGQQTGQGAPQSTSAGDWQSQPIPGAQNAAQGDWGHGSDTPF